MGKIFLNEETFGREGEVLSGTSAPSSSVGDEGSIYFQTDNKFTCFEGEASTSAWANPIWCPLDINNATSLHVKYKENSTNKDITINMSSFIYDPSVVYDYYYYNASTYTYFIYDPNNPTQIGIAVETRQNLTVYKVDAVMNNNEARIAKIFGKINNKWLEYQPN